MTSPAAHVALVETSTALPGLLPMQAWDVLGVADTIWVRDPDRHPSATMLEAAGLRLTRLEPAALERSDLDLNMPGSPEDRRLAKALVADARSGDQQSVPAMSVYLLGPDDDGLARALAGLAANDDIDIELVFFAPQPAGAELVRVISTMAALRDPQSGCPWDLDQDHQSLVRYLIEETYELVDAVEHGDDADIREELGDVLLQVAFHAQLASERRAFTIDDVANTLVDKLVARHPHVFSDGDAATADDVQANWDTLKDAEKQRTGVFDGVPRSMPALQMLDKLFSRLERRRKGALVADPAAEIVAALACQDPQQRCSRLLAATVAMARRDDIDVEKVARDLAARIRHNPDEPVIA